MKILFACGGTAGHINPAIAVASYIRERHTDAKILFAGNPKGMEAKLVPAAGFEFVPIDIKGFQRQLSWFNIKYNLSAIKCLALSGGRCRKIIQDFGPDVMVGTGGYVSGPLLRKGHQMGIKTLTHESNAFPGVTTKLLAKYCDKVLLSVEEAKKYLPSREYIITGNPVREEIIFADHKKAREKLQVGDRVCIVSFGGSLGARRINEAVAGLMAWEQRKGGIYHIHATGAYEKQRFPLQLQKAGVNYKNNPNLDIREYISDMPDCLAAADLVISRSGAITLSELEASGTASILIPSPNVAENHQYHNAMVLAHHDAAVVIEEKDLTPKLMLETVEKLCQDPATLKRLGKNAQQMAIIDANQRIYKEIIDLI